MPSWMCIPVNRLETDTMADFRLTDSIQPEIMEEEFGERCHRWMEAKRKNL